MTGHVSVLVLMLLACHVGADYSQQCDDIDTEACKVMQSHNPNVCSDPLVSEGVCRRFCGQCAQFLRCFSCNGMASDLRQCGDILTCETNQTCYMSEVTDFDGTHGYMGGCISKQSCVPHAPVQLVGRSSSSVRTACCDTDLCNGPETSTTVTTTPTTTTTTTPRPTTPACRDDPTYSGCHHNMSPKLCIYHHRQCPKSCHRC